MARTKFDSLPRRQSAGTLVWFSCGAASACVAKLAAKEFGSDLELVYCDTMATEHPDNQRFLEDVERWVGLPVKRLHSLRYQDVDDVFEQRKILATRFGAPCTVEMKKRVRFEYQHADDLHLFGMTADEGQRAARFAANNSELRLRWLLIEAGLTKHACLQMIQAAGIEIPAMYRLGYKNNNCLGCVKATSPSYWNKVRQDFPEVFERRCDQSRRLNSRLVRINGERRFLDELQPDNAEVVDEDLSCGPQCAGLQTEFDFSVERR